MWYCARAISLLKKSSPSLFLRYKPSGCTPDGLRKPTKRGYAYHRGDTLTAYELGNAYIECLYDNATTVLVEPQWNEATKTMEIANIKGYPTLPPMNKGGALLDVTLWCLIENHTMTFLTEEAPPPDVTWKSWAGAARGLDRIRVSLCDSFYAGSSFDPIDATETEKSPYEFYSQAGEALNIEEVLQCGGFDGGTMTVQSSDDRRDNGTEQTQVRLAPKFFSGRSQKHAFWKTGSTLRFMDMELVETDISYELSKEELMRRQGYASDRDIFLERLAARGLEVMAVGKGNDAEGKEA